MSLFSIILDIQIKTMLMFNGDLFFDVKLEDIHYFISYKLKKL